MKSVLFAVVFLMLPAVAAADSLILGNDDWPPFIIEGAEQGTSEKLVCQALERAGRGCEIRVDDWERVLNGTRRGTYDGIAAVWWTKEREDYLLFSQPYLTNRIVPVVLRDGGFRPRSLQELAGRHVALVPGYAYGEEIDNALRTFQVVPVRSSGEAIEAVIEGRAEVALVDELVARAQQESQPDSIVEAVDAVLAYRELYFAVSRSHPEAEAVLADFQRSYEAMLNDGSVNEVLGVDWLATDLGDDGKLDLVLRSGVSFDDLQDPSSGGSAYALEQSEYQMMSQADLDFSDVNYQVDGKSHSSLQNALVDVFGKDVVCEHQEYTSTLDCSKLFQKH
jgi:polar amino acid transport system substrate-binding protein